MFDLGVLDQMPVFEGRSAADSVRDSLHLAIAVEELGFSRFWVAEHHGDPSLASASPEVMVAALAARTDSLRVGTGCILTPNTTSLRIAENARLLSALAPGRVDVGLGRGHGAVGATAAWLAAQQPMDSLDYTAQVRRALALLAGRPLGDASGLVAVPTGSAEVEVWLAGSGPGGAATAAALGLPLAFAQFAHPQLRTDVVDGYRGSFTPSDYAARPRVAVAVRVACAEDPWEAEALSRCVWLPALAKPGTHLDSRWRRPTYPSLREARDHPLSRQQRAFVEGSPGLMVAGTPDQVCDRLVELATAYEADEIVVVTVCPDVHMRIRQHGLIAEALAGVVTPRETVAKTPSTTLP
jgi:luciferase family oxidoreductase group 1